MDATPIVWILLGGGLALMITLGRRVWNGGAKKGGVIVPRSAQKEPSVAEAAEKPAAGKERSASGWKDNLTGRSVLIPLLLIAGGFIAYSWFGKESLATLPWPLLLLVGVGLLLLLTNKSVTWGVILLLVAVFGFSNIGEKTGNWIESWFEDDDTSGTGKFPVYSAPPRSEDPLIIPVGWRDTCFDGRYRANIEIEDIDFGTENYSISIRSRTNEEQEFPLLITNSVEEAKKIADWCN